MGGRGDFFISCFFVIPEVLIGNPEFFCFQDKDMDSRSKDCGNDKEGYCGNDKEDAGCFFFLSPSGRG